MNRRRFCTSSASLALLATTAGVPGCRRRPEDLQLLRDYGSRDFPLVIDTHAHTFNGSDLQVSKFVSKVAVNEINSSAIRFLARVFGPILEFIVWSLSPSATKESELLDRYVTEQIAQSEFNQSRNRNQENQYQIAKRELERAAIEAIENTGQPVERFREPIESLSEEEQALSSLLNMPDTYEELFVPAPEEAGLSDYVKRLRAAQRFLVEMFQYRHVSTIRYFKTYSGNEYAVDLATPCLVDYDWWLDNGDPTASRIPSQIEVNEKIAALAHGRVHPFAPFDPFRQVLWNEHRLGGFSPIETVKDAIENRGFLGVKLYPPMGFGVYGNSTVSHGDRPVWSDKNLHPESQGLQFGAKLDVALDQLYEYCVGNDVAVMAHSNPSNLSDKDFAPLLDIEHWQALYAKFAVSGSFGHFNGLGNGADENRWQAFVKLLNDEADGNQRFADASYFRDVLDGQDALITVLRKVLFKPDGTPSPVMKKLMYGSDWKMLLMEVDSAAYLDSMIDILNRADQQLLEAEFEGNLVNNVLGHNAVEFLGLQRGRPARQRLEAFYDKYQIEEPLWMKKVDAQET